jgi:outer membrane receptor for monomeric catechols
MWPIGHNAQAMCVKQRPWGNSRVVLPLLRRKKERSIASIMRGRIVLMKKMLLLAGSVLAGTVATAAMAQQQQAAGAAEEAAEELVVTGSRLRANPNETAPLPITTVDAAQLRALGNSDPAATLRQIPALLASGTVADSLERGAGGVGQATLSLRQLGANRTLVLIDGWRHVSGVAGSQTVDVSTIPNALIERVDVLTGGASAVYGADAVTGVVNYVLKKNFEGLNLDAQFGISDLSDRRRLGQEFRRWPRQRHLCGGLHQGQRSAAGRSPHHCQQWPRQQQPELCQSVPALPEGRH